jgi:hypothetical protein
MIPSRETKLQGVVQSSTRTRGRRVSEEKSQGRLERSDSIDRKAARPEHDEPRAAGALQIFLIETLRRFVAKRQEKTNH